MIKINKKILTIILALLFIIWIILSIFLYTIWFRIENLINLIWNNIIVIFLFSLLIFSVRIFLFIPSTLIIIWLWVLTNNFLLTFILSTIWIFIWLLQTYYIWSLLEDDLEWGKIIKKIKPHLEKINKNWFIYVFIWCLTPVLPTDLICYSAWFAKYKLSKFLLAWMLWEIPLILIYSYLGLRAELFMKNINYIFILLIFIIIIYLLFKKYKK